MPRELIVLQIGQCGIQLGTRFWDLVLREHASQSSGSGTLPVFDDALSTFFSDPKSRTRSSVGGRVAALKARAVLVDMEEGVLNEVLKGPLGELFDSSLFVKDVSGAGNNWAHGFAVYGPKYREALVEALRRTAERCESLQSFFCLHSLGGGTGSGVGSYLLPLLQDEYPDVYRFTSCIFPSPDDDVITSPYNSVLSLAQLVKHADCVLPVDNAALQGICERIARPSQKTRGSLLVEEEKKSKKERAKAFDAMNTVAAHLLTNLTCSMRFPGPLNVDLNEITMNLVPFPRLHFLLSSVAPLYSPRDLRMRAGAKGIDQMFSQVLDQECQLLGTDPRRGRYLACGLIARGEVQISDLARNVSRLRLSFDMIPWNEDGFKLGICKVPPVGQDRALICLGNNCAIRDCFAAQRTRFSRLFKRRAHVHHYTQFIELADMRAAAQEVDELIAEYDQLQHVACKPTKRLKPVC